MSEAKALELLRAAAQHYIDTREWPNVRVMYRLCEDYLAAVPAPPAEPTRDWTEDAAHENGTYQSMCVHCGEAFFGLKGRVVCKRCAAAPAAEPVAQPKCDHEWRDMRMSDDPYALDECRKCGAVRGEDEDEPVAQQPPAAEAAIAQHICGWNGVTPAADVCPACEAACVASHRCARFLSGITPTTSRRSARRDWRRNISTPSTPHSRQRARRNAPSAP